MCLCVCVFMLLMTDSALQGQKSGETIMNSGNVLIKAKHQCTMSMNSLQFLRLPPAAHIHLHEANW